MTSAINALDYGSPSDANLASALAAAVSTNLPLFIPGTYPITQPLVISSPCTIYGAGPKVTTIAPATAGQAAFQITSKLAVTIKELGIVSGAANQVGITTSPSGGNGTWNEFSIFRDLHITGFQVGLQLSNSSDWIVDGCIIDGAGQQVGIQVDNSINVDAGDSCISNCTISGLNTGNSVGISQYSSGGLKITNSKIIGYAYGYLMELSAGAQTSDLFISNCSFESQTQTCIGFTRQAGSGTFQTVCITGNELQCASPVHNFDASSWLSGVGIVNNRLGGSISMAGVADLLASPNF
jgi:hypothetical protein